MEAQLLARGYGGGDGYGGPGIIQERKVGQDTLTAEKEGMNSGSRIFVAGHRGMVGSAILRKLQASGFTHLITKPSAELDLRDMAAVQEFFEKEKPEFVFLAAAKVGGIVANNTYRAEFLYDNLMIQSNVIHSSYRAGVKKLLFLGSSCIYPRLAPQPLKEEYLLTGLLEPTNEPYAIAKIAGIKMCDAYRAQYGCHFISAMPTNLYGPNDNYDLQKSHVIPALLRKFHEAKVNGSPEVVVWGTGAPLREFMHVDDLAEACLFLMERFDESGFVNVGTGSELSIRELAELIAGITGYRGKIVFDSSKPDGTPRKLMDVGRLGTMGWRSRIPLKQGLLSVYQAAGFTS
jgi:GDP-L-fucose synthase